MRRVIVIKKHQATLDIIKAVVAELDTVRADEIIFTRDPLEVIQITWDEMPTVIFSGQFFEHGQRGTELAKVVKEINPNILFFIYSLDPEVDKYATFVDGTIFQDDLEHKLLAAILTSDLDQATVESIMAMVINKAPHLATN